ncbi:MAG: hypothetical protein Q8L45_07305 [Xanthomonadaceae bacterium]|nr:hypothetical protein [Xanthomonadaceae bacterium]MDP2185489.1 hypothetical protein [Xanthomonadales bacterium]MDZ4116930.1 hypothetical protein [Xanthomonadaceae bacterium]MDZ4378030.1 hypothetical protein [Xanthomonadaceae bacterium]
MSCSHRSQCDCFRQRQVSSAQMLRNGLPLNLFGVIAVSAVSYGLLR